MSTDLLRQYWHPVAASEEVRDRPVGVQLLDERIVLYRAAQQVLAFKDLCIHRGTPLSLGWVEDDVLVCAYHGWGYAPDGACVRIPSLSAGHAIPRKARAIPYRAQERYGLVWVALEEPRAPIPELPHFEDPTYHTVIIDEGSTWETSAGRMIENFSDFSHFAWVHPGISGTPECAEAPSYDVERRGDELHYAADLPVFNGRVDYPPDVVARSDGGNGADWSPAEHRYRIVLPFVAELTRVMPEGNRFVITMVASPISAKRIRRWAYISRNFAADSTDEDCRRVNRQIIDQDRRIVENQRPEELPLDLSEELHLRGPDAGAVAYRRMLAEVGLHEP
jgi:vanillate O-demethylase monooxygenase subunit